MRASGLLLLVLAAGCERPPAVSPPPRPGTTASPVPWPDVAAPLPPEPGGANDAAVVVAIENYPQLPEIAGARANASDWTRFLTELHGVPAARVKALVDAAATRAAILAALDEAAAAARAGGRLWFVFVGHGGRRLVPADGGDARDENRLLELSDLLRRTERTAAQPVWVLDTGFDEDLRARLRAAADRGPTLRLAAPADPPSGPSRTGTGSARRNPVVLDGIESGLLPGGARPAFSYLVLGALRGWADADGDGGVTAREVATYTRREVRRLRAGRIRGLPELYSSVECRALTTLTTFHEKAPDLVALSSRLGAPAKAPQKEVEVAAAAVEDADRRVQEAHARHAATGGREGFPARTELEFEQGPGGSRKVRVVPVPDELGKAATARAAYAARLGGAPVLAAARALVEAARIHFVHGHLGRARELLQPVLEARCALDEPGYAAWELLMSAANFSSDATESRELARRDCSFDAPSARATREMVTPTTGIPRSAARRLYEIAETWADPEISSCYFLDSAAAYEAAFRVDPAALEQAEAAMNGGYAYRRSNRPDEAAALYVAYLRAQAHGASTDDARQAATRSEFVAAACRAFFDLVQDTPSFRPTYLELCSAKDEPAPRVPVAERDAPSQAALRLLREARDRRELASWEPDADRRARLREARELFRSAEAAWTAIADRARREGPPLAFLRLAEARTALVSLSVALGEPPSPALVRAADAAARVARDSLHGEGRKAAAGLGVELADRVLAAEEELFERTRGTAGIEPRTRVRSEITPAQDYEALTDPIPAEVAGAIRARDDYVSAVSPTDDLERSRGRRALEAARFLYLLGHFDEAWPRLERVHATECGRSPAASEAWELLVAIGNFRRDVRATRALAESPSCALDAETRAHEELYREPVRGFVYADAAGPLEELRRLPDGPERRARSKEAVALLGKALEVAPDRDEAPGASLAAARIYRELGEHRVAARFYRSFIDRYSNEPALGRLEKGDSTTVPPSVPDPERLAERLRQLSEAYGELVDEHLAAGDARDAALVLFAGANRVRLPRDVRLRAALRAAKLGTARGAAGLLRELERLLRELGASRAELARWTLAARRALP